MMKEPPLWLYFIAIVICLVVIWLVITEDRTWYNYVGIHCWGQNGTVMLILLIFALVCLAISTRFYQSSITTPKEAWTLFASFVFILVLLDVWVICIFIWGSRCRAKPIACSGPEGESLLRRGFCCRSICAGVGLGFLTLMATGVHIALLSQGRKESNLLGTFPLFFWLLGALIVNYLWVKEHCWECESSCDCES